ncbi:MAG TPA: UDP-N-acetylglucosamine 4,6-dehydratase (inverting) [Longimicrobium sp.]|nr:UDP-N-acetylglucosamine 4,6-dehydratase (inverting) [Longimicrobium sp.]
MSAVEPGAFDGRVVLVTGGTGSFGQKLVETLLQRHQPRKVVVFSRDEQKQYEMRQRFPEHAFEAVRYFLGDVRDRERLYRALDGVDVVVHAAALKQVEACEYNPLEAVRTNILGAANLIDAAIDRNVGRVITVSTDKAVNPVNLYGATKLTADKLFIAANNYSGAHGTRFGVVRYGNVVGSRGSVVPLFLQRRRTGTVPVTDPRMTRFWITLEQGVEFVLRSLARMQGGEIFVPRIPSMNIMDLALALAPGCGIEVVGSRPGEKLHEVLVSEDDARHTLEYGDHFVILPAFHDWDAEAPRRADGGRPCPEGFRYGSDTNNDWLSVEDLRRMVGMEEEEPLAV